MPSMWLDFENSRVLGRLLTFLVSSKEIFINLICLDAEFIFIQLFIKQSRCFGQQHNIEMYFDQELG